MAPHGFIAVIIRYGLCRQIYGRHYILLVVFQFSQQTHYLALKQQNNKTPPLQTEERRAVGEKGEQGGLSS